MIKPTDLQVSDLTSQLTTSADVIAKDKDQSIVKFGDYLNNALKTLNDYQVRSSEMRMKYITGEVQDIHKVIIAGEEAKLLMKLTIEVRNKLIEAYKEISRMPI